MLETRKNQVLSEPRPALADWVKKILQARGGSMMIVGLDWSRLRRAIERENPGQPLPLGTELQDAIDHLEARDEVTVTGDHHRMLIRLK